MSDGEEGEDTVLELQSVPRFHAHYRRPTQPSNAARARQQSLPAIPAVHGQAGSLKSGVTAPPPLPLAPPQPRPQAQPQPLASTPVAARPSSDCVDVVADNSDSADDDDYVVLGVNDDLASQSHSQSPSPSSSPGQPAAKPAISRSHSGVELGVLLPSQSTRKRAYDDFHPAQQQHEPQPFTADGESTDRELKYANNDNGKQVDDENLNLVWLRSWYRELQQFMDSRAPLLNDAAAKSRKRQRPLAVIEDSECVRAHFADNDVDTNGTSTFTINNQSFPPAFTPSCTHTLSQSKPAPCHRLIFLTRHRHTSLTITICSAKARTATKAISGNDFQRWYSDDGMISDHRKNDLVFAIESDIHLPTVDSAFQHAIEEAKTVLNLAHLISHSHSQASPSSPNSGEGGFLSRLPSLSRSSSMSVTAKLNHLSISEPVTRLSSPRNSSFTPSSALAALASLSHTSIASHSSASLGRSQSFSGPTATRSTDAHNAKRSLRPRAPSLLAFIRAIVWPAMEERFEGGNRDTTSSTSSAASSRNAINNTHRAALLAALDERWKREIAQMERQQRRDTREREREWGRGRRRRSSSAERKYCSYVT